MGTERERFYTRYIEPLTVAQIGRWLNKFQKRTPWKFVTRMGRFARCFAPPANSFPHFETARSKKDSASTFSCRKETGRYRGSTSRYGEPEEA